MELHAARSAANLPCPTFTFILNRVEVRRSREGGVFILVPGSEALLPLALILLLSVALHKITFLLVSAFFLVRRKLLASTPHMDSHGLCVLAELILSLGLAF
jgi:hypothetical protein